MIKRLERITFIHVFSLAKLITLTTFCCDNSVFAQSKIDREVDSITTVASTLYERSKLYRWLWGDNWRAEWTTPVRVPVVYLDTLFGGLAPYKTGGGNETKSLRLQSKFGQEYVIRSIDKSRKQVIPPYLRHSVVGGIIQDGVSMSYPYAALGLTKMLQHANIYHTNPRLFYIPRQNALDSFNTVFANGLYLFEERPDGNWSDATHLGNFDKFYSTNEVISKLQENNGLKADQKSYIKARLFDILVSDWDKHHDNWRWGMNREEEIFMPIPRDRDQAFFTRNGILNTFFIRVTRLRFMQKFDHYITSVSALTSQDRQLDRTFTNQMLLEDWLDAASELQQRLADTVIEQSIMHLPPEVFSVSGKEIIQKIKSRRDNLQNYAAEFYFELTKKVKITGSKHKEHFIITELEKGQISLEVFRFDNKGKKEENPVYQRIFFENQTKVIEINGFGGDDLFDIPHCSSNIKVFIRNIRQTR